MHVCSRQTDAPEINKSTDPSSGIAVRRSSAEPCVKVNLVVGTFGSEDEEDKVDDLGLRRTSRALRSIPGEGSTQTTSLKTPRRWDVAWPIGPGNERVFSVDHMILNTISWVIRPRQSKDHTTYYDDDNNAPVPHPTSTALSHRAVPPLGWYLAYL